MSKDIKCKYCDKVYKKQGWHYRHLRRNHSDCSELFWERMFMRDAVQQVESFVKSRELSERKDMPSRPIKWVGWNKESEVEPTL